MGANPLKRVLAASLLLFILMGAGAALQRIDVALAGAHLPTAVSGGVGDIASVGRITDGQTSLAISAGWAAYDKAVIEPGPAKASTLLAIYLGLDVVLMLSLGALLVMARCALLGQPDCGWADFQDARCPIGQLKRAILGPHESEDPAPGSRADASYAVAFWSIFPIML